MGNQQPNSKSKVFKELKLFKAIIFNVSNMREIYKITNIEDGKIYIGQTKYTSEKRFNQHIYEALNKKHTSIYLNNAICKYGVENFTLEVLEMNLDDTQLDEREQEYIKLHNSVAPHGYNIQFGGQNKGRQHCEESRERMREQKLGEKNHNFGKPRSDETKSKISAAKSGEKHHFYGKHLTEDHRLNLSKSHKSDELPMYIVYVKARPQKYIMDGYVVISPNKKRKMFASKKYSLETKLKMAIEYLNNNTSDMSPVQRLDGNG